LSYVTIFSGDIGLNEINEELKLDIKKEDTDVKLFEKEIKEVIIEKNIEINEDNKQNVITKMKIIDEPTVTPEESIELQLGKFILLDCIL
jgi:hypothetical protein